MKDWIDDLKILCMSSVVNEDSEYLFRDICRWYSREFSTPLHVVETLPLEDVLRHYFESKYEDMPDPVREQEIFKLKESEESLKARQAAEDAQDAEAWEFGQYALKLEKQKKAAESNINKSVNELNNNIEKLKDIKALPPNIKMEFVDTTEEDVLLEGSFGPPPKPPKSG